MEPLAALAINTIRTLSIDAIQKANSGHPGLPMGCAPMAYALWHGHLRHERCGGIAFVERPFMGKASAFVAFLNVDGGVMFKVFVGRDENRALKADQLDAFRKLAARLG